MGENTGKLSFIFVSEKKLAGIITESFFLLKTSFRPNKIRFTLEERRVRRNLENR